MKYEVIESAGQWIVRREEAEIGRFETQDQALDHVARSLRDGAANDGPASLSMRYERRQA